MPINPAVERYLLERQHLESYGNFKDNVFSDLLKVLKWVRDDVRSAKKSSIKRIKKDADFVWFSVGGDCGCERRCGGHGVSSR